MAAVVSSPPPTSPPSTTVHPARMQSPSLPPITTTQTPRRSSSQRVPSYANKRMSTFSNSRNSNPSHSRPESRIFSAFHSSLPYTLVRDFAYPISNPAHYGPPPNNSGVSTPASEVRRLSDPAIPSWDDRQWSATPPWFSENTPSSNVREQLPATVFSDGGPPYSEDEDLHSPVVTTSRHKKHKSTSGVERGRSPGAASRGLFLGSNGDGSETYYVKGMESDGGADGPGGELVTYPPDQARHLRLDANLPLSGEHEYLHESINLRDDDDESIDDVSEAEDELARFSRDYSFTIASPDEEMHGKAVALFDFESEHQNELPLKEGQIILVSYRHGQGWLVAEDPKTKESGLVPEEFVRLVRDIEGGLNGLAVADIDGGGSELVTPVSAGVESATTPTIPDFSKSSFAAAPSSNGNNLNHDKHPSVQSTFSTSSKDLDPYPLPGRAEDVSTPNLPSHPEDVNVAR